MKRPLLLALLALVSTTAAALAQSSTVPISGLPPAATPLSGSEMIAVVQAGATRRAALSSIFSSRALTCSSHEWMVASSSDGHFTCSQPAFSDISGTLGTFQLPSIGAQTLLGNATGAAAAPQQLTSLPDGFAVPGLPGRTANVQSTGTPGLDFTTTSCTGDGCGWMLYAAPGAYPAANPALLRVQKSFPATGGVSGNTYSTAWIIGTTGQNDAGYVWNLKSELNNRTRASTGAQNVATSSTARDDTEGVTLPYSYAPIWGIYGEAYDMSGQANPDYAIHGGEIDAYVNVGAGTDVHKQRVMLQLAGGVQNGTDGGAHIGRGLLIGTNGGAVLDNAIEVNEAAGFNTFLVEGNGSTSINAVKGNWASNNTGKSLLISTSTGATNPAIGLSDNAGANWVAAVNYSGDFYITAMPLPTNSTTIPTLLAKFGRTGTFQLPQFTAGVLSSDGSGNIAPVVGVSCSGSPTGSFAATNGVVTHC